MMDIYERMAAAKGMYDINYMIFYVFRNLNNTVWLFKLFKSYLSYEFVSINTIRSWLVELKNTTHEILSY